VPGVRFTELCSRHEALKAPAHQEQASPAGSSNSLERSGTPPTGPVPASPAASGQQGEHSAAAGAAGAAAAPAGPDDLPSGQAEHSSACLEATDGSLQLLVTQRPVGSWRRVPCQGLELFMGDGGEAGQGFSVMRVHRWAGCGCACRLFGYHVAHMAQ
jgi:hypothetical protein